MTVILKYVYINKVPELVIQYNNITHKTIKTKSTDVNPDKNIDVGVDSNIISLNLRLVLM